MKQPVIVFLISVLLDGATARSATLYEFELSGQVVRNGGQTSDTCYGLEECKEIAAEAERAGGLINFRETGPGTNVWNYKFEQRYIPDVVAGDIVPVSISFIYDAENNSIGDRNSFQCLVNNSYDCSWVFPFSPRWVPRYGPGDPLIPLLDDSGAQLYGSAFDIDYVSDDESFEFSVPSWGYGTYYAIISEDGGFIFGGYELDNVRGHPLSAGLNILLSADGNFPHYEYWNGPASPLIGYTETPTPWSPLPEAPSPPPAPIPLPASIFGLGAALAGLGWVASRHRNQREN